MNEFNEILKIINKILRHDILNHLATASMALELYENKKDEKYLKTAFKAVHRSIDLIKQMKELEFFVETGHEISSINIREKIDSVISTYQIDYSIDGNCQVLTDQGISSVIGIIVDNAIKHGKADRIDFRLITKEKTCEIIISDNGIGIPLEIKDRIFEAGFGQGVDRGAGLGLFVIKKFIERYEGEIKVQDTIPQGTTFIIILKRAFD
ncbi:MAG: HAMP domain-containing histidine kinase [Candidatus Methanofastidiosum sp.]|nr:HAMP domain-containing histidine kinase [Methanofastidiosum sp.]